MPGRLIVPAASGVRRPVRVRGQLTHVSAPATASRARQTAQVKASHGRLLASVPLWRRVPMSMPDGFRQASERRPPGPLQLRRRKHRARCGRRCLPFRHPPPMHRLPTAPKRHLRSRRPNRLWPSRPAQKKGRQRMQAHRCPDRPRPSLATVTAKQQKPLPHPPPSPSRLLLLPSAAPSKLRACWPTMKAKTLRKRQQQPAASMTWTTSGTRSCNNSPSAAASPRWCASWRCSRN